MSDNQLEESICRFLISEFPNTRFRVHPDAEIGIIYFGTSGWGPSGCINVEKGSIYFEKESSGTCQEIALVGKIASTVASLLKIYKALLKI